MLGGRAVRDADARETAGDNLNHGRVRTALARGPRHRFRPVRQRGDADCSELRHTRAEIATFVGGV